MNDKSKRISVLLQEARNPASITPEFLNELAQELTSANLSEIAFGTLGYVRNLTIAAGQVAILKYTAARAELESHGKKPH